MAFNPQVTTGSPFSFHLPFSLESSLTRHLPDRMTHASSRRATVVNYEHQLENDIESHTHNGKELSEDELDHLRQELHRFEGMTLSDKERWVDFMHQNGVRRRASAAGMYEGGVVLM